MSENDAISRISDIKMPNYYLDYYASLSDERHIQSLNMLHRQNLV